MRNVETRQRHPLFSRPIAASSGIPLRSRSRGRRVIASSIAHAHTHTQSSPRNPTMSARNRKEAGGGVSPPTSETGALSSALFKGGYTHLEAGLLLLPSRYKL